MENIFNFNAKLFTGEENLRIPRIERRYYCPFCGEEVLNGDDVVGIDRETLCHWNCYFNRYRE